MPEPHNSISPDKPDQKRDALLVTKIGIPRTRSDLLPASPLLSRLAEATVRELVLVSSLASLGKTTFRNYVSP